MKTAAFDTDLAMAGGTFESFGRAIACEGISGTTGSTVPEPKDVTLQFFRMAGPYEHARRKSLGGGGIAIGFEFL